MRKLYHIQIFVILFLFNFVTYAATIKGTVTDSRTGEPLAGANVVIMGTHIGAATNNDGFYIIKNLTPRKYIIKTSFIIYKSHIDSVNITGHDEVIELNIKLKSPIIDLDSVSTPALESYHKKLQELNEIKPVMSINIDSMIFSNNFLTAYFSMTNNIDDSFYIFKNYRCYSVIKPVITDNNGKLLKRNIALMDCMGEKTCPDSGDLILIKPGETIHYPVTKLEFYNFSVFPKGKYSVKIKYECKKPEEINTFYCGGSSIQVLITGLRGTYISSNSFEFINQ